MLENVSRAGFRCTVREWIPAGAVLPNVKLSITSPRLYTPGAVYPVTCSFSHASCAVQERGEKCQKMM